MRYVYWLVLHWLMLFKHSYWSVFECVTYDANQTDAIRLIVAQLNVTHTKLEDVYLNATNLQNVFDYSAVLCVLLLRICWHSSTSYVFISFVIPAKKRIWKFGAETRCQRKVYSPFPIDNGPNMVWLVVWGSAQSVCIECSGWKCIVCFHFSCLPFFVQILFHILFHFFKGTDPCSETGKKRSNFSLMINQTQCVVTRIENPYGRWNGEKRNWSLFYISLTLIPHRSRGPPANLRYPGDSISTT